ncbi:MAG TPA: YaiI/YqxD family protein [Clostridiales bacterium]|nr:YaiI/YqxD family protein [Clostridiales bacterium]
MKIFIDGDGCPVKGLIEDIAKRYAIKVVLVTSIAYFTSRQYKSFEIIMVDNVPQAADMAIINRVKEGDIVVTQDFGLASVVLSKKAMAISFTGRIYETEKMDTMLFQRYLTQKIKRGGGSIKGPPKRTRLDDERFEKNLIKLITRGKISL